MPSINPCFLGFPLALTQKKASTPVFSSNHSRLCYACRSPWRAPLRYYPRIYRVGSCPKKTVETTILRDDTARCCNSGIVKFLDNNDVVRVVPSGGAPMNNSDMMGFCRVHLIRRIRSSSSATTTGTTSTTPPPICSLCSTETRGKSLKPSRMAEFRWETRMPLPVDVLTNKCLQNDNTKVPFTSVMLVKNVAVVVITSDHGPAKTEVGDHDAGNGRGHDHYNGKV